MELLKNSRRFALAGLFGILLASNLGSGRAAPFVSSALSQSNPEKWMERLEADRVPALSNKGREVENFKEIVRTIERHNRRSIDRKAVVTQFLAYLEQIQKRIGTRRGDGPAEANWLDACRSLGALEIAIEERPTRGSGSPGYLVISLADPLPDLASRFVKRAERMAAGKDRPVLADLLWYLWVESTLATLDNPFNYYVYSNRLHLSDARSRGKSFVPGVRPELAKDHIVAREVLDPCLATGGLLPGSRLIGFDGRALSPEAFHELFDLWFRPAPFSYRLSFDTNGQARTVQCRAIPLRHSSVSATTWQDLSYVRISFFSRETIIELRRFFRRLEAARPAGLILDLRANGGGTRSFDVVDLFFKPGQILGSFRELPDGPVETVQASVEYYDYPLVLLVDNQTASMAEMMASAVKTHNRGKIVGEQSFGKAVGQVRFPVGEEGALWLVDTLYFFPGTEQTWHQCGIIPDVIVSTTEAEQRSIEEFFDNPVLDLDKQVRADPVLSRAVTILSPKEQP